MRGLMGDATEDIIETLDSGSSENVDEEEIYHMADTMSQCGGLEAALTRCVHARERERESEPPCVNVCMFSLTLWWVVWISRAHIQTATHTVNNK